MDDAGLAALLRAQRRIWHRTPGSRGAQLYAVDPALVHALERHGVTVGDTQLRRVIQLAGGSSADVPRLRLRRAAGETIAVHQLPAAFFDAVG